MRQRKDHNNLFNKQPEELMLNSLFAFLSGIGISLIGIIATSLWQKRVAKLDKIANVEFELYMRMLNLYNLYFWIASEETSGQTASIEIKNKIRSEAWKIADLLRTEDNVNSLKNILRILMSNEYNSATSRHNDMSKLINELALKVNPKYKEIIEIISHNNLNKIASGKESVLKTTVPVSIGQLGEINEEK